MGKRKNKYNLASHKDEIITEIIKNLIWIPIAAIIPVTWGLIKTVSKSMMEKEYFTFSNVLAIIAIIVSIASVCFVLKNHKKAKKTQNEATKEATQNEAAPNGATPLTDFRIASIVAEMHIKSREELISTLNYNLIANRDGLTSFQKSVLWTGEKYDGTKLKSSNSTEYTLHDLGGNDGYHTYEVRFNKNIKCQDNIQFTLETNVFDRNRQMQPFYGYSVKHQIDKLTLRVVVAPHVIHNMKERVCWDWERLMNVGEPTMVSREIIGGNEVYTVEIPNPTLLYKYFLEWEFTA